MTPTQRPLSLRAFVATLSNERMMEIHTSYEKFEADGFIGEEACRIEAMRFLQLIGAPLEHPSMWMQQLVFEVYRRMAMEAM